MPSTPQSLVLGFAARLPAEVFRPFTESLRASGFKGRFILVLGEYDHRNRALLRGMADEVVDVSPQYRDVGERTHAALNWLRHQRGARRAYPAAFRVAASLGRERAADERWSALEYRLEGLQALRYRHYYDVLTQLAPDTDQVLISDLRDVVFQADPFEQPLEALEVFLEEEGPTLAEEPFNGRWVRNLYGPGRLEQIGAQVPSCSGTVLGPREAMLDYLSRMAGAISWRRRPLGSHDQGVHNNLLRTGALPAARVVPNGTGRVVTLGGVKQVRQDADGRVWNADGTLPAVVHQYDRHPEIIPTLLAAVIRPDAGVSPAPVQHA